MTKSHKQKVADFLNRNDSMNDLVLIEPSKQGVWRICGEDPNCDFGGYHSQPYLETVSGKLLDVVKYAVELPRFWSWGAGGSITEVIIKPITTESIAVRLETENKIKSLKAAIQQLEQTL